MIEAQLGTVNSLNFYFTFLDKYGGGKLSCCSHFPTLYSYKVVLTNKTFISPNEEELFSNSHYYYMTK